MSHWIVELPEGWKHGDCSMCDYVIIMDCVHDKWVDGFKCPLANAVKAVEVSKTELGELAFVEDGHEPPMGKPVKLWATEVKEK